jgi:hypothetical protein
LKPFLFNISESSKLSNKYGISENLNFQEKTTTTTTTSTTTVTTTTSTTTTTTQSPQTTVTTATTTETTTPRPRVEYTYEILGGLDNLHAAQRCGTTFGHLWSFDLTDLEIANVSYILDLNDQKETWTDYVLYASPWTVTTGTSTSNIM